MTNRRSYDRPAIYRIVIQGSIDASWSDWFDGLAITQRDGETLLQGQVVDQAALHGILAKVNDLGLTILSIEREAP